MPFKIDIFDKNTNELIHSITGCRTYGEAIKIAASFRDDSRQMIISEYENSQEPALYISKEQSEYVLSKTGDLLNRLEKIKKPSDELKEAMDCIVWLRRWFMPIVDLDNN